jgi:hypothetical protein
LKNGVERLFVVKLLTIALFFPPSFFTTFQFRGWRPHFAAQFRAFSTCKFRGSGRGVVGGGLGIPLAGFFPNTEISFLISPKLLDICPVFLLVFSPIKTADLLILF